MKKLLLILLCLPLLFSCGDRTKTKEDKNVQELNTSNKKHIEDWIESTKSQNFLPHTNYETGVVWYDMINENNINVVFCYYVPEKFNFMQKEEFVSFCKSEPDFTELLNLDINLIWRYYDVLDKETLLREIIVNVKDI